MIWVGLTGGIGTGKTTAAKLLRELGHPVIDADLIAHQVVAPGTVGLSQVVQAFGPDVLLVDQGLAQSLDRKKLASLVFNDSQKLKALESILHPLIRKEVEHQKQTLLKQGGVLAFYDVPLLFEKNMQAGFDRTLLIACSEKLQIERLKMRDGLTPSEIQLRLRNQMNPQEKMNLSDFVIYNESGPAELKIELQNFCKNILKDIGQGQ